MNNMLIQVILYLYLHLFHIKKSMLLIVKYLNVYYLEVDKIQ